MTALSPRVRPTALRPGVAATGVAAVMVVALAGMMVGAAGITPVAAIAALVDGLPGVAVEHGLSPIQLEVLYQIRLPRLVMGALVGAVLAMAGAAYQGVFRNPLADPFLLGVAAGAGLGATVAILFLPDRALVAPLAFVGGLVAVGVSYLLGRSVGGRSTTSLILAGVAVAAFATSVQTFLLQRNVESVREVYSWILGRLVTVGWSAVAGLLPYALLTAAVLVGVRRLLDVLRLGDDEAAALGVDVVKVRWVVVIAATLATAAAVSVSGLIAFVGIIVPHAVRLLLGWSYRVIVPMSMLMGAAFLMAADVAARTVAAPAEIPIGVVTAFFGAPFFLLVLRTTRGCTMIGWERVSVSYAGTKVLGPVTVAVADGEWVAVIGPNGAGKSTLLKTAVGLVDHEGVVTVRAGRPRPGVDIAWMPQRPHLPDEMGVVDYVMLGRTPHLGYLSSPGRRDHAAVEEAIAKLDLTGFTSRTLGTLSGGEAQRVVLARAVAQEAPVLLLDEPTSNLDVGHAVEVLEVLDALRRREGLTLVTALHDLTLAARFADRLVLLSMGSVVADGPAVTVLDEEVLISHYGHGIRVIQHEDGPTVLPRRGDG